MPRCRRCSTAIARACADVAVRPGDAEGKLVALDLARAVRSVDLRADLAVDAALSLDIEWIEQLVDGAARGQPRGALGEHAACAPAG